MKNLVRFQVMQIHMHLASVSQAFYGKHLGYNPTLGLSKGSYYFSYWIAYVYSIFYVFAFLGTDCRFCRNIS